MKIVLLNGPPRSGKDTAALALRSYLGATIYKFADPLKSALHALFGLHNSDPSCFESVKAQHLPELFGWTPREAYIALSEKGVKPVFGPSHFGNVLTCRLVFDRTSKLVAVPDSGFVIEALPLLDQFGANNILLLQLTRSDCSFEGDSRGYIQLPNVQTHQLHNDKKRDFEREVVGTVRDWLGL